MDQLSRRQSQIVTRLIQGESQKAVARELGVSYSTIRNHLRAARQRTDTRTSLELAVRAAQELTQK